MCHALFVPSSLSCFAVCYVSASRTVCSVFCLIDCYVTVPRVVCSRVTLLSFGLFVVVVFFVCALFDCWLRYCLAYCLFCGFILYVGVSRNVYSLLCIIFFTLVSGALLVLCSVLFFVTSVSRALFILCYVLFFFFTLVSRASFVLCSVTLVWGTVLLFFFSCLIVSYDRFSRSVCSVFCLIVFYVR